ncbi:hypothetical protein PF005_g25184 [Phytophthora fragariae]|uniref:Uncharacterized protein n=1 Tax=Phytophthora fragariae TaxID=53985 RepID=A0A6A3RE33_9STRA|nr:hypothetical protein PF003_g12041 [Phytophthora fragariae]KAE8923835.1 hypothetical protein PF009_g25919 [Phytophthora fragariae]KAE8976487.1 hypothetical protein PF011_g24032 [Phytophthora fragariae]KAE9074904.1 hypothetical protein PF007_g25217 [Phytophthora fragariae]KAE9093789.1 hypothetical protein PF006_g24361 [Phytophthora fragariae]
MRFRLALSQTVVLVKTSHTDCDRRTTRQDAETDGFGTSKEVFVPGAFLLVPTRGA